MKSMSRTLSRVGETLESYREELHNLHHHRVGYIVLGGGLLMLLFSLLDLVVVPEFSEEFLTCRIATAIFGLVLFAVNYRDKNKKYSLAIGFTGYLFVALAIMLMIYRMGDVQSPYYVGLIVTITLYVTLAPLTLTQALGSGLVLVLLYFSTIVITNNEFFLYWNEIFANMFFVVCFVFIIATQSWADTAARKAEYLLRRRENVAADELSRHATKLEREVQKRAREQAAMEERFHLLFNQIADEVVVVTPDGRIVDFNESFEKRYAGNGEARNKSFYNFIVHAEQGAVAEKIGELVRTGRVISDFRISLVKKEGLVSESEMNGNLLIREKEIAGVLLVIRDLTARKEMEERLKKSLEIKKKTEMAAILALAKLSEFRDRTHSNHLERIREYCKILATQLSQDALLADIMTSTYIEDIYHASILHDIGMVAVPDEDRIEDTSVDGHDEDFIRRHTLAGGDVIRGMEEESQGSGFLSMAQHIAYFHHERWDGKGLPYGLKEREIPLAARIMAVADTYEEMTVAESSGTISAESHERAMDYIGRQSRLKFDPLVVKAFQIKRKELDAVRRAFS